MTILKRFSLPPSQQTLQVSDTSCCSFHSTPCPPRYVNFPSPSYHSFLLGLQEKRWRNVASRGGRQTWIHKKIERIWPGVFFSRKTEYDEERCKKFTIFFGGGAKNGENILRDIVRVSFPSCWFLRRFSLNFFFSVELIPSSHGEVNMQRKI